MTVVKQKKCEFKDGKKIGYIEVAIVLDGIEYTVSFDPVTKKFFSIYAKNLGFVIGEVSAEDYKNIDKEFIVEI